MMRKNGLLMKRVVCACLFCAFFLVAIPGGAATRIKVLDFNIRKSGELAGYQVKAFAARFGGIAGGRLQDVA